MLLHNIGIIQMPKRNKARLQCFINNKKAFIEFDKTYLPYVTTNYDSFLIMALPIAMKDHQDITIKGTISYKLYHNVTNYLMKIITNIFPETQAININVNSFDYGKNNYNNQAIGTGISCGLDCLCTLEDYYFNEQVDKSMKITHVTHFTMHSKNNMDKNQKRFANARELVRKTDLKIFQITHNLTSINNYEFRKTHMLINLSIPLAFQKLFKLYYYSSTYPFPNKNLFNYDNNFDKNTDIQQILYDPIVVPLLSTEYLEFKLHGSQYTRPEKVLKISKNPLTYHHLDVCIDIKKSYREKINCSECEKCLRTLAALDHHRVLDQYKHVFDLFSWFRHKINFLNGLNLNDAMHYEIYELINKKIN